MVHKNSTEKKWWLAEFKFRLLGKVLWNEATMMRFRYIRHSTVSEVRTTGGIKHMGMHNRSENGRGAWVDLCAHPTHADT
jgi:hypothetical protein